MIAHTRAACLAALAATVAIVAAAASSSVDSDRAVGDAHDGSADWPLHGRTTDEQRYSPLASINSRNVGKLSLAWSLELATDRGQEATPLVVDGVMYATSSWSIVYAIDASTGELRWTYDPQVPRATGIKACCDAVNRGVAHWRGRLFVGTLDGRLIAIDARTGRPVWSTLTVDPSRAYTITGAPRVVKDKIVIGNGGAEFGVRGYVSAYDAADGSLVWRFYTVPGDPSKPQESAALERAARTWNGEWWKLGGGGTVWDSMAYDPRLDLLYVGTGNGSPWNQKIRSPGGGDNLYLSSIIALRPDTGAYVWHYQTTPGEMWDYTATQHIVLADLGIAGVTRKVLMQAPKNGFFYVLDRTDGRLISAEPFVPVNWAERIDRVTGRPVVNPEANYGETGKVWLAMPGALGAHSWHPMSFNPGTGLVYLPSFELSFPYVADQTFEPRQLAVNLGIDLAATRLPDDEQIKARVLKSVRGHLLAWDPVAQRKVWDVEHAAGWNGGILSTAGKLVFQGDASGHFSAYEATSGTKLWTFAAHEGIVAPPITYAVDGEQYVAVLSGWGGVYPLLTGEIARQHSVSGAKGRILAFRLNGTGRLPARNDGSRSFPAPPPQFADATTIENGMRVYQRYCAGCHGGSAVSGGVLPDLRMSTIKSSREAWARIVGDGALEGRGMVGFSSELSASDVEAVRAYVIARARHDFRGRMKATH